MSQKTLSKSEIKELNTKQPYIEFSKKDRLIRKDNYYFQNDICSLFEYEGKFAPTLKVLLKDTSIIPNVIVDMGAVKFIVNGADIMRPGIIHINETIKKNDVVVCIDQNNKKPLVVGIALFNAEDMKEGKVIKNIHRIGDDIWNL
jgi:PUA-domain protein